MRARRESGHASGGVDPESLAKLPLEVGEILRQADEVDPIEGRFRPGESFLVEVDDGHGPAGHLVGGQ